MPNHIHGIIKIKGPKLPFEQVLFKNQSLCVIVDGSKTWPARNINALSNRKTLLEEIFFDHIIRNEKSLNQIREYVINNPTQWKLSNDHY